MRFKQIALTLSVVLVSSLAGVALTPGSASAAPPGGFNWIRGFESNKCLTVHGSPPYVNGADIDLYDCMVPVQDNQRWSVGSIGNPGFLGYILQSKTVLGKVLTVRGGGTANGTRLELWDQVGFPPQDNQLWWANIAPHQQTYYFMGRQSNKCATVHGGGSANNTPIDIWDCLGQTNQMWTVTVIV